MMQTPITIPIMIESLRRLVRIIATMLLMPGMVSTTVRNRGAASHEKELTNNMAHSTVYAG